MKHTLESLLELAKTPEGRLEIRREVAIHVGYQFRDETWSEYKGVYDPCGGFISTDKPDWHPYPDYTTSLDAMAKARKDLTVDQLLRLQDCIQAIMPHTERTICRLSFAEPITHAIAFILTKQEP